MDRSVALSNLAALHRGIRRVFRRLLFVAVVWLTISPASADDPIIGQATVIDGDTLEIHGQRIRLNGIDAPESRQTCERADGTDYRCGQAAAFALADWIGRATVHCEPSGQDRYKRIIATCFARGDDMGRWMVQQGHALAFRRYSTVYVPDEIEAQAAGRGIWQGRFVAPWDWRKGERLSPASAGRH